VTKGGPSGPNKQDGRNPDGDVSEGEEGGVSKLRRAKKRTQRKRDTLPHEGRKGP